MNINDRFSIQISNLTVKYSNNIVLDDLNLNIPNGAFAAIVGPNGSGKTTLLKVLLSIVKPSIGTVFFWGHDKKYLSAGDIGYVPQFKTLDKTFPATSLELVLSGIHRTWLGRKSKDDIAKATDALEKVGAKDYAYEQLSFLSGGQLQRVYLARCFVANPKILLLDEPATGIDLVCENSLNSIINDYNKTNNTTVIMVTHDWSAAYHHTEYVLLLNKKQIYYGDSADAFTPENLQLTFSHLGHKHNAVFGLKSHD